MKLSKQKKQWMIAAMFVLPISSYAQGSGAGHVGGGDVTASDFQYFMNRIDQYLLTEEGKQAFPEVKQPEFHTIVNQVRPVVKDERVYDSFGVAQTCISHAVEENRFFQCDSQRLPKIELDNQPTFYRLTFHELLFQAGLELPASREVPSDFKISSRLKLRLQTEWVPGLQTSDQRTIAETGFICTSDQDEFSTRLKYVFVWNPDGSYVLLSNQSPKAQVNFGYQQYQTLTKTGNKWMNIRQSIAHFTDGDVITKVIARGNSMSLADSTEESEKKYLSHDEQYNEFSVSTSIRIANTPAISKFTYTEFPMYLNTVNATRKKDQFSRITMICSFNEVSNVRMRLPLKEIFEHSGQTVFKQNFIRKYKFQY